MKKLPNKLEFNSLYLYLEFPQDNVLGEFLTKEQDYRTL